MSDDLVERLYDRRVCSPAQNSCCNDYVLNQAAERIEELEAKLARAEELVKVAFNEGFCEGMDEVQRQRGGKNWYESRSRQRLAELKGEIDEDEI